MQANQSTKVPSYTKAKYPPSKTNRESSSQPAMTVPSGYLTSVLTSLSTPLKVTNTHNVEIPGKFNCVDKTEHILAAGCGSNIIFWDLRKMKQRS